MCIGRKKACGGRADSGTVVVVVIVAVAALPQTRCRSSVCSVLRLFSPLLIRVSTSGNPIPSRSDRLDLLFFESVKCDHDARQRYKTIRQKFSSLVTRLPHHLVLMFLQGKKLIFLNHRKQQLVVCRSCLISTSVISCIAILDWIWISTFAHVLQAVSGRFVYALSLSMVFLLFCLQTAN